MHLLRDVDAILMISLLFGHLGTASTNNKDRVWSLSIFLLIAAGIMRKFTPFSIGFRYNFILDSDLKLH